MMRRTPVTPFGRKDVRFGHGGMPEIIEKWGRKPFYVTSACGVASTALLVGSGCSTAAACVGVTTALFTYRGVSDINQKSRTILRNFPVLGHVRYIFESIRPEIRQYFVESDQEPTPFTREQRALVYQRAKSDIDSNPFGTRRNVYGDGYEWIMHSLYPAPVMDVKDARVVFGAKQCKKPYSGSIFNVSAMSFGAISSAATMALNGGAKLGNFYSNTGEGGLSKYHLEQGGDIVWNIGSGYFGCRMKDGKFDVERFRENANRESVRMIEIKLSQGAKPGHGGVLPGKKVTSAIAEARGVQVGETCESPARHSAFSSPETLLEYAAKLRDVSGGKPVGIKLCMGDPVEFAMIVQAMKKTGMYLDFVTIDGGEGGTGAAPAEYTNHVGTPLLEGLYYVNSFLTGAGVRDHVRVIASGKICSGFSLFRVLAMGADTGNAARGFMFSLGCIQSLKCHTNACPTGIATQDEKLVAGLDVTDKKSRVYNFHRRTVSATLDLTASCGFNNLGEIRSRPTIMVRTQPNHAVLLTDLFPPVKNEELLTLTESPKITVESSMKDRVLRSWVLANKLRKN